MSRLTDAIDEVSRQLARYPGDTEDDALNRRVLLRKAFSTWGDERYREGHTDGMRDVYDARSEAERRAEAKGGSDEGGAD